jgi:hypothetical protein
MRNVFLFLVSTIFVIGGVWLARNGDFWGWWVAGFFALGVIVAVVNSLPGSSYLRLDNEGFTTCSLFRSHTFRWSDVERFEVARISTNKMVVFNFSDTYLRQEVGRKIATAMAGYEGALPESYGLSPEELAKLLNRHRLAAGSD